MKLKLAAGVALALLAATTACSGAQPPTTAPTASTSTGSVAGPTTPSPAATESSADVDVKALRLTEKDLGSRWKSTSSQDERPEAECNKAGLPGGLSSDQVSYGTFAERKGAHPAQVGIGVVALAASDDATLGSAARKEIKACDGKSKYGWYLTSSFDNVRSVKGSDQVLLSYLQTAYGDKGHQVRLYVRQGLLLRSGPVVVDIDNAFVPASDKAARSVAATEALAAKQLSKLSS